MVNVAVTGCGGAGGVHLSRWANLSGARIAAVCDSNVERARRVASEFGAEAYTDWHGLLEGGGFDVVDVCVPTRERAAICRAALQSGAHVLCEPPLGITAAEVRSAVDAADSGGRLLMPVFVHRFHPLALFARELIENDDLGRIVMFRSRLSGRVIDLEENWITDREQSGGGVLMDMVVHSIDLFCHLVGEAASAVGRTARVNPALAVEDSAAIVLQSESGGLGVVESSWSTPGGANVLELYGTAGACVVDFDSARVRYLTADMSVWQTREIEGPDRYERIIGHFADSVRGNQAPEITSRDALRASEIIEQVYAGIS
jgi:predicted dehydrogenase